MRKMKKKPISKSKKLRYSCCVCKRNIRTNAQACGTILIKRGIEGNGKASSGWQTAFAHGKCLVRVLPVASYSFLEFVPRPSGRPKRISWPPGLF